MSLQSINDPRHWYDRPAEMRALAETMANEETKAIMEITGVKFARSPSINGRVAKRTTRGWSEVRVVKFIPSVVLLGRRDLTVEQPQRTQRIVDGSLSRRRSRRRRS
jgi:hypothetical protein